MCGWENTTLKCWELTTSVTDHTTSVPDPFSMQTCMLEVWGPGSAGSMYPMPAAHPPSASEIAEALDKLQEEKKKRRSLMNIYLWFLINALENEIVASGQCIGKSPDDAALGLPLSPDQLKLVKTGDFILKLSQACSYEPVEIVNVRERRRD